MVILNQFYAFVLLACVAQVCDSSPARRELQLTKINTSSPTKINDLTANESSNIINSSVNVEDTIKEVEDLIKGNPSLPRLTRGEILDIIENITKSDKEKVNKTRSRNQKAVMLVMPYSPDSAHDGDVQALYTKPPITHLVGDPQKKDENKRYKRPTRKPQNIAQQSKPETTENSRTPITFKTTTRTPFIIRDTLKNDVTSPPETSTPRRYTPQVVSQKISTTTILPFKPLRRRTTTTQPVTHKYLNHKYPNEEIITAKSTKVHYTELSTQKAITKSPTTRAPQIANHAIKIISPPKFHSKPEPQYKPPKTQTPMHEVTQQTTSSASVIIPENMQLPEDFQDVLKNLDVLLKQDLAYTNSHDPLISLPSKQHAIIEESNKNVIGPAAIYQLPEIITTSVPPPFQSVANNLTPDMKELLMSFGLIPDPNKVDVTTKRSPLMQPSSEIKAESYSSFKPLPEAYAGNNEEGMDELLAKYGLGARTGSYRTQKAIAATKPQNELNKSIVNIETNPDDLKNGLKDTGITYKDVKQLKEDRLKKGEKMHVFSPGDLQTATRDDVTRLNQVLDVIRQLEKLNGSVTDEDLKDIDLAGLKQLVGSLNVPLNKQNGPNPLDFDKGLVKNEVKRQQSTTTTTIAPASSTEARNPSLSDLEDSFGGSAVAAVEVVTTTTQAPSKTGFYYLVDWNTFFDIDNQKGQRVNLRFQPTVGDPKRFFSVTVP